MYIKKRILNKLPYDERTRFHDLSKLSTNKRKAFSRVLNFYSSIDNIGNYTPILGIQTIMEDKYDVWCCHDKNIDWNFVNNNYDKIIIGGAGLFHESFTPFWKSFIAKCRIPSVIWGVGGIFPKNTTLKSNVNSKLLKEASRKCDLINLRDNLTANYIDNQNIHISPCPTIAYLNNLPIKNKRKQILYSSHEELLSSNEKQNILKIVSNKLDYKFTDNIQYKYCGLNRIIKKYQNSKFVITTRLHGAIIAYGLGIPYIAISFDNKLDEFYKQYGNGLFIDGVNSIIDIDSLIDEIENYKNVAPNINSVLEYGRMVLNWLNG